MQAGRWVGDRGAGAALAARGRHSVWMAWFGMRPVAYGMAWHGMGCDGDSGCSRGRRFSLGLRVSWAPCLGVWVSEAREWWFLIGVLMALTFRAVAFRLLVVCCLGP
jgi:hypothetical protein